MQSRAAVPISACMLLLVVVLIIALPLIAQQPTGDAALVQQFFPQSLVDKATTDFNNGGPEPFQASAFCAIGPLNLN